MAVSPPLDNVETGSKGKVCWIKKRVILLCGWPCPKYIRHKLDIRPKDCDKVYHECQ